MNKKVLLSSVLISLFSISSCNSIEDSTSSSANSNLSLDSNSSNDENTSSDSKATYVNVYPISYQEVNHEKNMEKL